ncbi:tyrosine-type recombinase/integrase [Oscillospiraceae bacterium LTW-04]|nr:site-specific integrase [Oscillospiraceae bacterium MB24-C1]
MPRRGENIYKRKDGRWEGRVLAPDGKYRYTYAKTYKEVKTKKQILQKQIAFKTTSESQMALNAATLFENWLNGELINKIKPTTYDSYYRCLVKYVIPFFEESGNEKLTAKKAAEFVCHIGGNADLSESYKRKLLSIFKTAVKEIMKDTQECESIINAVKLPRKAEANVQVFSIREQRLIEKAIISDQSWAALGILLCFYTGLRLGEVCALRWGDIDFDAGTMLVERTVSRIKNFEDEENKTRLTVGNPKSRKSIRKIPVPAFMIDISKQFKKQDSNENFYILTSTLVPMEPRTFQKLFKRIQEISGVKSRKFHAIRHTFATRALELGVDIKTLSEILGHANVSTTLNIYAHSLFEQKKNAMDRMNNMYIMHASDNAFAVLNPVITA